MDKILINGKESYDYGVGYMNGEVGINYFNNETEYDDGYVHMRSFVTVDKQELEKLNMTPEEFVKLINQPEGENVDIDVYYNGFPVGVQSLKQYICVEVGDEKGRVFAREENKELLDFIKKDIDDQVQYDTAKAYQKDLSFKNVAVFITDEKRTPVDGCFIVGNEETNVTINYNPYENKITVAMDANDPQLNLASYFADAFGKDREEYVDGDIMYMESSPYIHNIDIEQFKQLLTNASEALEKNYEYKGLTAGVYGNDFGYIDGEARISYASEHMDYNCSAIAETVSFTESQVKELGYTPKKFATLINSEKGDWITFKVDYMNGVSSGSYEETNTFPLTYFAAVQVMTDDYKTCLAYEENENELSRLQKNVDEQIQELNNQYPIGKVHQELYGYAHNKWMFGTNQIEFYSGYATDVNRIVFTESQVKAMGYEPQTFVEQINNPQSDIMVGIEYDEDTQFIGEFHLAEGIHPIGTFNTIEVVSDDSSILLAYAENERKMENVRCDVNNALFEFEMEVDEMMAEAERREKEEDHYIY